MRYSESKALNDVYELIGVLFETEFESAVSVDRATVIAAALLELGEDRSWASVWWAYGAIHHDLSDEALAKAEVLLRRVSQPSAARAAALMLLAELHSTQALQAGSEPDLREQVQLLSEAVDMVPTWPSTRVRLARALHQAGENKAATSHARAAVDLSDSDPSADPYDTAFSGLGLRRGWAAEELRALGLLPV